LYDGRKEPNPIQHCGLGNATCKLITVTMSSTTTSEGENHTGRRRIIIGASYGIGRATADILSTRGAHVVYCSRSLDKLNDAIKGKENCHAVVMDASDPESTREGMVEGISKLGGGVDCVIYCPGYFGPDSYGSFEQLFDSGDYDSGWEGSINIHLKGMMNCFRHTRKHLISSERGGVFVGMSSIAGSLGGHSNAAIYAICKAAVDMALKQLALEYAELGVRVYSVAPGLIDTPAIHSLGSEDQTKKFLQDVGSSHAMKRHAEPSECGELIAFLASERASFMTGGPIYVDGGAMLRTSLGDAIKPYFMRK
jgi:NAD(P)-dependent dehydrogenase (short-subunit alcohol dehydrogenase family)